MSMWELWRTIGKRVSYATEPMMIKLEKNTGCKPTIRGRIRRSIVVPLLLEANLTGEMYLELLENTNKPVLLNTVKKQNYLDNQLIFEQDGAFPQYALPVQQYLDQHLPVTRLVGDVQSNISHDHQNLCYFTRKFTTTNH